MNKLHEWVNSGLIAIVVILLLVGGNQSASQGNTKKVPDSLGGFEFVTNFDALELSKGQMNIGSTTRFSNVRIGVGLTTGTTFQKQNAGLCYLFPYEALIPASTTKKVECQATAAAGTAGAIATLPGIRANDWVVATLSTTTAGTTYGGLKIAGAGASTTAGYIELYVQNGTGADFTWPTSGNASGTAYYFTGN